MNYELSNSVKYTYSYNRQNPINLSILSWLYMDHDYVLYYLISLETSLVNSANTIVLSTMCKHSSLFDKGPFSTHVWNIFS